MTWEAGHDRWKGQNRPGPTWFRFDCSSIAFGNQTISLLPLGQPSQSLALEIHGFVPLPHGRFTFVVCNRFFKERAVVIQLPTSLNRTGVFLVKFYLSGGPMASSIGGQSG